MVDSTLTERIRAASLARRSAAAEVYREVLLRHEHPERGDEAKAAEAMAVLGRTAGDLAGDLELVARISECRPLADAVQNLLAESKSKMSEVREAERERDSELAGVGKEWESKLVELRRAHGLVHTRLQEAAQAKGDLERLERRWAALVDGAGESTR